MRHSAGIKAVYYWYADADMPPGLPSTTISS